MSEQLVKQEIAEPVLPERKHIYSTPQKLLVLGAAAIGSVYAIWWQQTSALWYSAVLLMALTVFVVLQWDRVRGNRYNWVLFATVVVTAVMAVFFGYPHPYRYVYGTKLELYDLQVFSILMLPVLMMVYAVFVSYGIPVRQEGMAVIAVLKGFFVMPFFNVPHFFLAGFSCLKGKGEGSKKKRRAVFVGILVTIPVAALVLMLLSSADDTFHTALAGVFSFRDGVWNKIWDAVIFIWNMLVCGMLFYSFLYGTRYHRATVNPIKNHSIPDATMCVVEGVLLAIYVAFVGFQFSYLFGGTLPAHYTFSEYAVKGFTELILVTAINMLVLALSVRFGSDGIVRHWLEWGILAATGLLLGSAALRLFLYIQAYGWTELRLMSAWLEMYLAALVVMTGVRFVKKEFALTRTAILVFVIWFIVLQLGAIPFLLFFIR